MSEILLILATISLQQPAYLPEAYGKIPEGNTYGDSHKYDLYQGHLAAGACKYFNKFFTNGSPDDKKAYQVEY